MKYLYILLFIGISANAQITWNSPILTIDGVNYTAIDNSFDRPSWATTSNLQWIDAKIAEEVLTHDYASDWIIYQIVYRVQTIGIEDVTLLGIEYRRLNSIGQLQRVRYYPYHPLEERRWAYVLGGGVVSASNPSFAFSFGNN